MQLTLSPERSIFHLTLGHLSATANREALTGLSRALTERDLDWDWHIPMPGYLDVYRDETQVHITECLPCALRWTDDEDETVTLSEQQAQTAGHWIRDILRTPLNVPASVNL